MTNKRQSRVPVKAKADAAKLYLEAKLIEKRARELQALRQPEEQKAESWVKEDGAI